MNIIALDRLEIAPMLADMETKQTYRSKWMDPDFRRDAKTSHYCGMCQRDLKDGQPHRRILFRFDHYEAIHNEDWEIAVPEGHCGEGFIEEPIGMDCARRLGLEWTRA